MKKHRTTETSNEKSLLLDEWSSFEIVQFMNQEDDGITNAVKEALPMIALAVDGMVDRWKLGGRIFVIGAGTSGRLGVVDAVELVPTFSIEEDRWIGILAGGYEAMWTSLEETEDDEQLIQSTLENHDFSERDVLIGVTASGSTPFVLAAIHYGKERNGLTIGISNNENTKLSSICDYGIEAITGPEVIRGSTRLKAGTAQKMVLNMLSTASMVRVGKVYRNEMVDMKLINNKLVYRAVQTLMNATDLSEADAARILKENDHNLKVSIFRVLTGGTKEDSLHYLGEADGHIKHAIQLYYQKN
ncbi:N-acetylmuramic acid 6-phosphate etherase [Bacillus sp. 522_BSPC]|uniref:N-acetylmuramic acid 6-phosphate etherase n=1 Tax=Bacillus sp. 522_BSPC TaxID=1579338 RepID=UPI0006617100|nr:N-acetylmuramic acid 6-phosphate etherase [Bacillus sp. 522_BSPC]